MKKSLIFIILFVHFFGFAYSKDFHFIYVAVDKTIQYELLNYKLSQLIGEIDKKGEDFVLFYSNAYPKLVVDKVSEIESVKLQIANIATYTAIDPFDELSQFISIFQEKEVCKVEKDTTVNQLTVKPLGMYHSIVFDVFVGNTFFKQGFHNSLLAKFLFASDLHHKDFNVDIIYYNSSTIVLDLAMVKFNELYSYNNLKIFLK